MIATLTAPRTPRLACFPFDAAIAAPYPAAPQPYLGSAHDGPPPRAAGPGIRAVRRGRARLAPARPRGRDVERGDRRRGGAAARDAAPRPLRGHSTHPAVECLQRRPAGQDHDLPWPARAAVRP